MSIQSVCSVDDDAHVRRYRAYCASLAANLLLLHARLCPICITRGARQCDFASVLVPIIEGRPDEPFPSGAAAVASILTIDAIRDPLSALCTCGHTYGSHYRSGEECRAFTHNAPECDCAQFSSVRAHMELLHTENARIRVEVDRLTTHAKEGWDIAARLRAQIGETK